MERTTLARRVAPVAVFAAVLGGIVLVDRGGSGGKPRPLPIGAASARNGGRGAEDAALGTSRPASAPYYWTETRIPDALLQGLPDEGPAYTLKGGSSRIEALAKALGLSGEVRRVEGGWTVGSGEKVLSVMEYAGLPWYLGAEKPEVREGGGSSGSGGSVVVATAEPPKPADAPAETPVPQATSATTACTEPNPDGGFTACEEPAGEPKPDPCPPPPPGAEPYCAVAPSPVPAPTMPPQPTDAQARAVIDRIVAALGLDDVTVTMTPGYMGKEATAAPVVGGLPTVGWEARATVAADGGVVYASGFLSDATRTATYPLLDPREAVKRGGVGYARDLPAIATAGPEAVPPAEPATDSPLVATGAPGVAPSPGSTTPAEPSPAPEPSPVVREARSVRLGLMFVPSFENDGEAFLVPAWLLTFEGSDYEEPYVALPDEYLQKPPAPSGDPDQPVCDPSPCPTKEVPPDAGTSGGSTDGSTGAPPDMR